MNKEFEKMMLIHDLRKECEYTLQERAERYLMVKPHPITPYKHFSHASSELSLLFRDGHFYACIALTQAVTEGLVRFLCGVHSGNASEKYEDNLNSLCNKGHISKEMKKSFKRIWKYRNDFHHMNPAIEKNRIKLEKIALEKLRLFNKVERELFSFAIVKGKLIPNYPDYWKTDIKLC